MKKYTAIDKILVPVPLNGEFAFALTQALNLQQVYGSKIILINVVSKYSVFHKLLKPKNLQKHHKKASQKLKKLTKKYFNGEIPEYVSLKIEDGNLITSILKAARKENCDLIIMKKAMRLRSRFSFLKTENADKLIAESRCPVLSISSLPTPEQIKTIMIPVEVLKQSDNKVLWAISLAKHFKAKVHLVSVLNVDIKVDQSLSYKRSKSIEYQMRIQGIEVEKMIIKTTSENPVQLILNHAASLRPDLMIIMTRKETIIGDNNLGSFTREIIHNAHTPVLSVVPEIKPLTYNMMKAKSDNVRNKEKQIN